MSTRALRIAYPLLLILYSLPAHARDAADWSWITRAVGKSSRDVFSDGAWAPLSRKLLPTTKLDLGWSKKPIAVADDFVEAVSGPADDVVLAKGLVRASGCRLHSCMEKALVVFDVANHQATFALVHFQLGKEESRDPMLLIVSTTPAPLPEHVAAIDAWLVEKEIKPGVRRYLRPTGDIVNPDAPSKADLDGTFGFDWLARKSKCAAFKDLGIADPAACWLGEGSSFTPVEGKWYHCPIPVKKAEVLLYPSQKICQDQLLTMEANE